MVLIAAKFLLIALLAILLWVTDDVFEMVQRQRLDVTSHQPRGDSPNRLASRFSPLRFLVPAGRRWRVELLAIAVSAVSLGSHRLVIDNLHNRIRDVDLALPLQSRALDPAPEGGLSVEASGAGFRIRQAGSGRALVLFAR
jgi:hypothetical protein